MADRDGGLVATTTTLNFPFGNGISVPGAGFLLNNEMDDFTAKPGSPNAFGLVQGTANAIAPGRRPLSSMSPTLVFRPDGEPWLATGSPGRQPHHHHRAAGVAQPHRPWRQPGHRGGLTADPQPALARCPPGGAGHQPRHPRLLEAMGHEVAANLRHGGRQQCGGSAPQTDGNGGVRGDAGSLGVVDPRRAEGTAVGE